MAQSSTQSSFGGRFGIAQASSSRKLAIGILLTVALVAFELFNFDTTQYALTDLLGEVRFMGVKWATILAIAFCAIDFAGLVRIFTPERGANEPKEVWYLTGAWFLGTLANAVLTWWAVSLTLLDHEFGNEVLSREQLLRWVPIFVAALVWLTRILFISAFSVAGEEIFQSRPPARQNGGGNSQGNSRNSAAGTGNTARRSTVPAAGKTAAPRPPAEDVAARQPALTYEPVDDPVVSAPQTTPVTNGPAGPDRTNSRIRQRPPVPGQTNGARMPYSGNQQQPPYSNRH